MTLKNTLKFDTFSLALSLLVSLLLFKFGNSCPSQCVCDTTAKRVYCRDTSIGFPSAIPSDTQALAIVGTFNARFDKITHLKRSHISHLAELRELFITYSDLTTIDEDAFQDLELLRQVTFPNNKISSIPKGLFQNLPNLVKLDLSGNFGCTVESGSFSNIPSLQYLYAGYMNLGTLKADAFHGLTSLKGLHIQGNNLNVFHEDTLSSLTSLKVLDISDNNLKTLPSELEPQFSKLKSLYLADNPWHCNCEIEWMRNLPTSVNTSVGSDSLVLCLGPDRVKYQTLISIPSSQVECAPKIIDCGGPINANYGTSLKVSCKVEAVPVPSLRFSNPDQVSADDSRVHIAYQVQDTYMFAFTIGMVTEADGGQWTVMAANNEGFDRTVFQINVLNIPTSPTSSTTTTQTTTSSTTTTTRTFTTKIPSRSSSTTMTPTSSSTTRSTSATMKMSTSSSTTTEVPATSSTTTMSTASATTTKTVTTGSYSTSVVEHSPVSSQEAATSAQLNARGMSEGPVAGADPKDIMGIVLAGVFGGGTIIAVCTLLGYILYKRYHKNSVKPFNEKPEDVFDVTVHRIEGHVPPISTACV